MRRVFKRSLLGAALLAAAATANANVVWQLAGPPVAGTGAQAGTWAWSYNAVLTAPQQLRVGTDFSALIDFPGYVAGSASWTNVAPGFTGNLTTENTTAGTFFSPGQSDSPTAPNFRVTNAGASTYNGPGGNVVTLGTLNLRTTAGGQQSPTLLDFFTLAQKDSDLTNVYTIGFAPGPVPEPGTLAMLAAGVLALGAVVRRRAGGHA